MSVWPNRLAHYYVLHERRPCFLPSTGRWSDKRDASCALNKTLLLESPLASPHKRQDKRQGMLEKSNFSRYFNVIWVVQSPIVKIFGFSASPNQWLFHAISFPQEGRSRSLRTLGAGCDGRGGARDGRADAYDQVVWSWRPDAGAKFAKTLPRLASDGGKRARSPRRSRRKPLKPSRRECRLLRCTCGC